MANLVTLSRLPLLAVIILFIYSSSLYLRALLLPLIGLLFLMDWIDGLIARRREEVSELGSILDIAIDRVVESLLWVVFADIDMVPVWAPLLVITRGFIVDTMRGYVLSKGETPFEMIRSKVGRFLVSSRFMRGLYGFAKAMVFLLLASGLVFMPYMDRRETWMDLFRSITYWGVVLVVGLSLLRGIPVVVESRRFFSCQRKAIP